MSVMGTGAPPLIAIFMSLPGAGIPATGCRERKTASLRPPSLRRGGFAKNPSDADRHDVGSQATNRHRLKCRPFGEIAMEALMLKLPSVSSGSSGTEVRVISTGTDAGERIRLQAATIVASMAARTLRPSLANPTARTTLRNQTTVSVGPLRSSGRRSR